MSVVGGYVLHLYCDHPAHRAVDEHMAEFGGKDSAQAWRDAKRHGWRRLRRRTPEGTAVPGSPETHCPLCARTPERAP